MELIPLGQLVIFLGGNTYWQRFKGKECTALEFVTNLASGTTFVGHTANANDRFYALPYAKHTITVSSEAPAGSKTVFVTGEFTWTDTSFTAVSYNFTFSSIGEAYAGGTLSNIWIKLCTDNKGINALASKKLVANSITVGREEKYSFNYIGTLSSSSAAMNNYICIWWNNQLQFTIQPMAQVIGPT